MISNINEADFTIHTQLIVDTLKTQDKKLLTEFKQLFSNLMSSKYFAKVLAEAIQDIVATDPETYQWILQNRLDDE